MPTNVFNYRNPIDWFFSLQIHEISSMKKSDIINEIAMLSFPYSFHSLNKVSTKVFEYAGIGEICCDLHHFQGMDADV